jgi:hypothetical protein
MTAIDNSDNRQEIHEPLPIISVVLKIRSFLLETYREFLQVNS